MKEANDIANAKVILRDQQETIQKYFKTINLQSS